MSTSLTLNMGAFSGKNLMHNIGDFCGESSSHNICRLIFYLYIFFFLVGGMTTAYSCPHPCGCPCPCPPPSAGTHTIHSAGARHTPSYGRPCICILHQWRSEGNWRPGANSKFAPPPLKKIPKKWY